VPINLFLNHEEGSKGVISSTLTIMSGSALQSTSAGAGIAHMVNKSIYTVLLSFLLLMVDIKNDCEVLKVEEV